MVRVPATEPELEPSIIFVPTATFHSEIAIELPRDFVYSSFKFNTSLCPERLLIANAYVTTAEATRLLSNRVRRVRNVIVEGRAHSSLYHIVYPQDIDCERTL